MNAQPTRKLKLVPHLVGERFFTVPKIGSNLDNIQIERRLVQAEPTIKPKKENKIMRYAAYIRVSSDEQVGNFSIDAHRRAIATWVKAQEDAKLVMVYIDEAQSGRTLDRPEFQNLRRDAKKRKFDAVIVHKFDRFARNRTDAMAIKSLLRQDYGIKVYSVSEPSEDSDGAIGALIEGIMESVADWYSRNLSNETTKGKRERAAQGFHNNRPPLAWTKPRRVSCIPTTTN